ncbi:MAG: type II secretion system F family protein [Pirellulaceae bacterium]
MSHPEPPNLSPREAESLVRAAAQLAEADLPLAEGLQAAAGEAASGRMSRALRHVARAIENGSSLEQAITACGPRVPPYLGGFLNAAEKTGKLGVVLTEWVENQWAVRNRWREVTAALTYPLISLALAGVVFLFLALYVIPPFKTMMMEFGLRLPVTTLAVFWMSDVVMPQLLVVFAAVVLGLGAVRLFGGRGAFSQLVGALPLVGKLWYWSGSAEGLRAVGMLIENQVPLPQALTLAASGISDAYIGQVCRQLGQRTKDGQSLGEALIRTRLFPMSIIPVIRQGEQQGTLDSAFRTAAKMLEDRVNNRSLLVIQILPPMIFVGVALLVGITIIALFMPLIGLVQGLA